MNHDPSRAEALFLAATEIAAPQERATFLDKECGDDHSLRRRVEALLASNDEAGGFLQPAAPNPDLEADFARFKPEETGERIGNYKLLQQIGEGGFGTVWMAEQGQPLQRRVALKIIKLGMDTTEVIARFEQERQALAMMDHPNIAKVFEAGVTPLGRPFFVMELVAGIKVTDYCDQASLPTMDRLQLFIAICQAVQHAHQKGIIHRDLKPSNILVSLHDGVPIPKVIDFGVAKAIQTRLTERTLFTRLEQMIGTPLYMSPEQAELSGLDIDTRSDIYSLGVLLYELLTGRTPFDPGELMRRSLDEIRRTIREQEPSKPSTLLSTMAFEARLEVARCRQADGEKLVRQIRGDLDWIVMKALEKDRTRRYESANELARDLRRHLDNEPVLARPPGTLYRFRRLVRRNKVSFATGTAVVATLVTGAGVSIWQGIRAQRGEALANAALADLRATAPAFVAQAHALTAKEHFAEAIEKLDYAIKLRPDAAEYLLAKADLLECQFHFVEAAPIYLAALRLDPGNARARANVALCEQLGAESAAQPKLSRESLVRLLTAMTLDHRTAAEMMPVRRLVGFEKKALLDYWVERLKELPIPVERPIEQRLVMLDDGSLELDLQRSQFVDASPLEGMPVATLGLEYCNGFEDLRPLSRLPLRSLNLHSTKVSDLSPLSAMPTLKALGLDWSQVRDLSPLRGLALNWLSLSSTSVTDLTPLHGMPLGTLHFDRTPVSDLAPLAGMPLDHLRCSFIPAVDFSPLAGAPLESLLLVNTRVGDLSFLLRMPLKTLALSGCSNARHFQTLVELKSLEKLELPESFLSLPKEELMAIEALRTHPTLREIYAGEMGGSKEAFFKQWDQDCAWVLGLHRAGVRFGLEQSRDGTWKVDIADQPFSDLSLLRNAPIGSLGLNKTQVSDLTPLAGMPLKSLSLLGTRVSDLSPLAGTPLTFLAVQQTPVSDLSVLRGSRLGSSLQKLYLMGSKVTDFSPVAACTALTVFHAAETALRDLEMLRGRQLTHLYIEHTRVRDLSVLAGMPLEAINFHDTDVIDLTPLLRCPTLERINLPRQATKIEALRALPKLREIAFGDKAGGDPAQRPSAFWAELRNSEARRLMEQQQFKAAEAILTRAVDDARKASGPESDLTTALEQLATCYCWEERFSDAVPLFREIVMACEKHSEKAGLSEEAFHWVHLAVACVAAGKTADYSTTCAAMLRRFRDSRDTGAAERVIRTCSLAPDSGVADAQLRPFAAIAEPMEAGKFRDWYRASAALAEYRAGRWNVAADLLKKIGDEASTPRACADVVLAMVHHRLEQPTEASARMDRARKLISAHWQPPKEGDGGRWHDWLIAYLLLKEADALVGAAAPPKR
ncbi:MAG: hypothetical protein QOE70_4659 [Chthoniobacter sp.]|jgi:serine/threonine protein kinase/Leucine-rich repeat (LRR) protein/Flp pilus assembly protein TadD|nr:hypothetical protein [Chthoniobacter sp.]